MTQRSLPPGIGGIVRRGPPVNYAAGEGWCRRCQAVVLPPPPRRCPGCGHKFRRRGGGIAARRRSGA